MDRIAIYKEIVDPDFIWQNFSAQDQRKILTSYRSNNYLDTERLERLYPDVKNIKVSIREMLCLYKDKSFS